MPSGDDEECYLKAEGGCGGKLGLLVIEIDACPPERVVTCCEAHARR